MRIKGKTKRYGYVAFVLGLIAVMISAFCLVDPVSAASYNKFNSTFETIASEPDWTRARSDGVTSHPYMDNGLLTTGKSGIYRAAEWLPHNYTYQMNFFVSSLYSQYNGQTCALFRVGTASGPTGAYEVTVNLAQSGPAFITCAGGNAQVIMDHTYYLNVTVSQNRTISANLWSWSTGVQTICTNAMAVGSSNLAVVDQVIYIGSLSMLSGTTYAHGIYVNYAKLDYWSGWNTGGSGGGNDYDNSSWSDIDQNIRISMELIVFFMPIMILAWTFGKAGFMLGSGLMSIIWLFSDPSFLWAGVLMMGGIGIFAYRGGLE